MSEDMGCGSSKRTAVVPIGDSVGEVEASGGLTQCNSEVPAMERRDPQKEQPKEEGVRWSLNSGKREPIAQPMAFEVSVTEESIIRKHPPRRLQRLEDQQMALSHELLDEKQEEAKQRRFQILSQRVQSAKRVRKRFLDDENNQVSGIA
ncbi:hypothetical protein L798_08371 [Zootermopsis nevadensis]|uniref:Uncharacterized protein n=1 Tax=Zootermopsis nevadensis TaxID=136037 RepID=A0A067RCM8_ZOONE|nr:hypothetical protein L798_08371 [Zootermopsis nevadensis]